MNILLFGLKNSITDTIERMLATVQEWHVTSILFPGRDYTATTTDLEIAVISLAGTSDNPQSYITRIAKEHPSIPILVLHYYKDQPSIQPILKAGALGYLQLGSSESKLHKAVRTVSKREPFVGTENT